MNMTSVPASVPGDLISDLHLAKLIPDPFYEVNGGDDAQPCPHDSICADFILNCFLTAYLENLCVGVEWDLDL